MKALKSILHTIAGHFPHVRRRRQREAAAKARLTPVEDVFPADIWQRFMAEQSRPATDVPRWDDGEGAL